MKKIIINLISEKLILYNTNFLCHHVEHILFYLWFKYEIKISNYCYFSLLSIKLHK